MRIILNQQAMSTEYPRDLKSVLSIKESRIARDVISTWPGYEPTPLIVIEDLAKKLGVKKVLYKDESSRFGLGSFKSLGGAYAVYCLLVEYIKSVTGKTVGFKEMCEPDMRDLTSGFTIACATAGNHGRSVAWGAELFGCPCHIYLHAGVGTSRAEAIAHYGATIHRVAGNYDDSVRAAARDAEQFSWTIVSDTSYPGYMDIPLYVMRGYTVMLDEIVQQLETLHGKPTHIFLQAGVGGLASAACAYFWDYWGDKKPHMTVVEPENAACLFESCRANELTEVKGNLDTYMLGLACGEPSYLAWQVLSRGIDTFMTIDDAALFDCMRELYSGVYDNRRIIAGESAVAGLVGAQNVCADDSLREKLGLTSDSTLLLFGTEGNTDPVLYNRIINDRYSG